MAENAANSLTKGTRVIVSGRLEQRSWETENGDKRSIVEINADEIAPSLRFATAVVTRTPRAEGSNFPPSRSAPRRAQRAQQLRLRRGAFLMPRINNPKPPKRAPKIDIRRGAKKKPCSFCQHGVDRVDYKDLAQLRKYISDRGKIRGRKVSGNCQQHQRDVTDAIKTARELALLPYTQRTVTERRGGGSRGS